jgi:DNA-binding XRE family transcriptional regulator
VAPPEPVTAAEVRVFRHVRGLSQAQVAEWLGCTRKAVAHWETGRHAPSRRFIGAIRQLLAESDHHDPPESSVEARRGPETNTQAAGASS